MTQNCDDDDIFVIDPNQIVTPWIGKFYSSQTPPLKKHIEGELG
ncbi:hypothetical protein VB711_09625 [Cronbergia sp. UHCC 0137]|nr:hypothetical protein [Cronbergia sp. UHCC 0137]MEA5618092.1 hypothetical protein [Cronbergia sp. UHCC 0137]